MKKATTRLPKITVGYRVGKLTVSEPTDARKNGYMIWRCICHCGNEILLDTRTLQRGTIRDCGCATSVSPGQKDLTGIRFGRLVCLAPTDKRGPSGGTIWRCKCDCGNECLAVSTQLTQGYKKSCGCLGHPPVADILGAQFGDLTVIAFEGNRNGRYYWRCKCTCGNETVVRQNYLLTGKTKSCGCLQAKIIKDNMKFIEGTSITLLEKASGRLISSNSSGHNGVYWNKKSQKWVAQITFKGITHYLGSFEKIQDAVTARKKAEDRMYGEFLEWYHGAHPEKTHR